VAGLVAFAAGSLITAISGVFVGALVGFALVGIGKPIFDIGSQTYISERVPYVRRARALGILELSWAGGLLLGAPLAGWLISGWGWELPFWVFGTLALVAIGSIYLLLDETDSTSEAGSGPRDQPRTVVLALFAAVAATGFTHELVLVVLGAWLEADFGMSLIGLAGVGFVLGSAELVGEGAMVAFTDRLGKRNSFALGLGVGAVFLTALAAVNQVVGLGLGSLFVVTLALEFAIISGIPLASEYRPNSRSRFLAWFLVVAGVGRIGADLVGPRLFDVAGMSAIAAVAAGFAAVGVVILLTLVREVDAETAVRPPL
jgi:predicted MFS family arabinose efflux permease